MMKVKMKKKKKKMMKKKKKNKKNTMKISGQIHAAIFLPRWKVIRYALNRLLTEQQNHSGRGSEDNSPCSGWGSYGLAAHHLATIQLSSSAY